ncbi:FAS1 domain-containing protein [Sphaerosporella brunnea]|uniref:FAS1 domain-containing protein n=1 Tax=Sphaerosporella brunnea TaxID=1250544 RepID=A0A5J5F5Q7_9PEZI|nr:FAS1 domain-containing protein [Sphaerosporella brunnea]
MTAVTVVSRRNLRKFTLWVTETACLQRIFRHPRPPMPPSDPHGPHKDSTIWELISSKQSRFADLIKKDRKVMDMLDDKKANITVFAPSNHAFAMLDKFLKHKDIPKDLIHRVLMYHVAPGTHESQDLRYHNTLLTKLSEDDLGKDEHQRLRIGLDHLGPNINFYSRFTMFDIYCNNGVIHAIDAILLPPPDILDLIEILPTQFSTTEAALERTGLLKKLPELGGHGLTIFAPSNRDWKKLGLKLNAFLFSKCGTKYLRALMKYHISTNCTLYSDALVCPDKKKAIEEDGAHVLNELDDPDGLLHGYTHVYLSTMLDERHISIDINRWERWLSFRANGLNAIAISDVIAKSGSIQVPDHVLIPPHSIDEHRHPPELFREDGEGDELGRGEYSVRQLKAILEPYVAQEQKELNELRSQRGEEL